MSKNTFDSIHCIQTVDEFNAMVLGSENKCIVLDIHQSWCGPCDVMNSTYAQLFSTYEDAESRLSFATAAISVFKENIKGILSKEHTVNVDELGCMPMFLILRFGHTVAIIRGANPPQMAQAVSVNIPELIKDI